MQSRPQVKRHLAAAHPLWIALPQHGQHRRQRAKHAADDDRGGSVRSSSAITSAAVSPPPVTRVFDVSTSGPGCARRARKGTIG